MAPAVAWSVLRAYLILGFALEMHTFVRLYYTSMPLRDLAPSLPDAGLDAIPIFRRLFGTYCVTLGVLRLLAAIDVRNRLYLSVLAVTHTIEALFSISEVLVYQATPLTALLTDIAHAPTTAFLGVLVAQMSFLAYMAAAPSPPAKNAKKLN
ncbi:Aste57867_4710 [Aphanomyces stellatus]|uniref:Aste57867_4710 protein n=1 Tax=Aphanomyces stellatus TaxID=120398 RepID=A0A485KGA6_9STRA|nr:hypothetical protein As57867_004697 [Aphanomyces stellatus]VFT81810.1 Aste57867_4710 [Aphanomyces stellatus]